jgi:hypothetical protein
MNYLIPFVLLSTVSLNAIAQDGDELETQSPDQTYSLIITSKDVGDAQTEWKCWLTGTSKDTVLLTTSILSQLPAPVAYWNESSTRLIYEEQHENFSKSEIRIYDLIGRKVVFKTNGFVWGHDMKSFDQANGILVFVRMPDPEQGQHFNLLTLDVATQEIKVIHSVKTSGDPVMGVPSIQSMDSEKRELVVTFEDDDWQTKRVKVSY